MVRWLKPTPTPRPVPTALSAYAVLAVMLGLPGALKVVKAVRAAEGHPHVVDLLRVLSGDAALACASMAVTLGLALLVRRARRFAWLFGSATTFTLLVLFLLTAIEHQAWVRSSSLLDWSIFWYSIEHYRELKPIIAAETTVAGVLLLVGAGLLAFVPVIADVVAARWFGKELPLRVRPALLALMASVPLAIASTNSAPNAPALYPLTQSAALGLVTGAFSAARHPADGTKHFAPADVERARARIERSLAAANFTQRSDPGHPKNVLLIVLESTRFDATSVYVPRLRNTPRLQGLAEKGLTVSHAYADMPHTSKALVSIICGHSPRFSVEASEVEPGGLPRPCLPHILGNLGYRRGYFQAATGSYESRHQFATNAGYEDIFTRESYDETGFEQVNYLAVEDKVMVEPILRWLDVKSDKPFLLTVLTCITHHSYGLPSRYPLRQFARQPAEMGGRMPRPWSDYNRYLNTVEYADQFMGSLIDALKERGKLDDTLIVVTGDHGQGFYEHGQKAHNTVIWDEGLHVPLVVSNPKLFAEPRTIDGVRRQVDIVPTVLSGLNVTYAPNFFEGRDLTTGTEHEYAYSSCWYNERCMAETSGSLRVIDNFNHQPMEMYDLAADPFERTNLLLSGSPEERAKWEPQAAAAHERMRAYVQKVEDFYEHGTEVGHHEFLLSDEPDPTYPARARVGDSLELIGYDTPSHEVVPDGFWDAIVYFKCLAPIDPGWRFLGVLETADGRQEQVDHHPANGRFYLHQCKPGSIIADHVRVWIPGDFPKGEVRYWWGSVLLKDLGHVTAENKRLGRRDITPMQRGVLVQDQSLLLAKLQVKPQYRSDLAQLLQTAITRQPPKIDHPLNVRFGDNLVLLAAKVEPGEVRRQSSVTITTTWQVEGNETGPWQLMVHMDSRINGYWLRRTHTPVDGIHPVANWEPGTWVVDTYTMPIAAYMPAGEAKIWLGVRAPGRRMPISNAGTAEVDEGRRLYVGSIEIRP